MFDNLFPTYKKKVIALLLGSLGFLIIAYMLSFSKTVAAYYANRSMQDRLAQASTVEQDIVHYNQLLADLSKKQSSQFSQQNLFEFVTNFCQQQELIIQDMPTATVFEQNDYKIITNFIEVQGNFVAITQLLYALEQEQQFGYIVSSNYRLQKNRNTRQQELVTSIYLQNIQSVSQ